MRHQGLVTAFTMGYVQDRLVGNSGGLGGAFGLLWAIGCAFPYPEGHPWQPSWQQRVSDRRFALAGVAWGGVAQSDGPCIAFCSETSLPQPMQCTINTHRMPQPNQNPNPNHKRSCSTLDPSLARRPPTESIE